MGLISQELSLDFKTTDEPKTINVFLREISRIENVSERSSKLDEYIKRLEEEMKKIDAFKRELPLCMILLSDAIVMLKEEIVVQCPASKVRPAMEEFIPLTRDSDEDSRVEKEIVDEKDKKKWMRSAQLWSNNSYSQTNLNSDDNQISLQMNKRDEEDDRSATRKTFSVGKYKNGGGAFVPFKGFSGFPATKNTRKEEEKEVQQGSGLSLLTHGIMTPRVEQRSCFLTSKNSICSRAVPSSSTTNNQSNLQKETQSQEPPRKQRRCWSPNLHERFVNALQQLGGSQVATPKQIRDLMKVEGLTNDEVKSHLQKYRLHTRRVPAASAHANQQSVVLGELWVSQDQCGASKPSSSQSESPQGPLQLTGAGGGISTTGGDSMEDEEDRRSESYNWRGHLNKQGEDDA